MTLDKFFCGLCKIYLICDAMLFIGIFSTTRCLSHFLQMYSLDGGIENLLDNSS